MKLLRRLCCVAAALALVWMMTVPALGKGYTYTVRIYAGRQGAIVDPGATNGTIVDDGDYLEITGLAYNDRVNFRFNMAKITGDDKYYVKGLRLSGRGTEEIEGIGEMNTSFPVDRDQDYVVAYGVLTNPVAYTVNYRDASGRDLAPSETYYGNVGDHPVIAYLYIEGYQPQAYNLTKTLSEDPAENVFTFVYNPLPEGQVYTNPTTTTTVVQPGGTSSTTSTASDTSSGDENSAGSEASSQAESSQTGESVPDEDVPAADFQPPVESWNLDDGDVPLADYEELSSKNGGISLDGQNSAERTTLWSKIPLPAKISGAAVLLGGGGLAVWLLVFRRKEQDQ